MTACWSRRNICTVRHSLSSPIITRHRVVSLSATGSQMLVDLHLSVQIFRVKYNLNVETVVTQGINLLIRFGGKSINLSG